MDATIFTKAAKQVKDYYLVAGYRSEPEYRDHTLATGSRWESGTVAPL